MSDLHDKRVEAAGVVPDAATERVTENSVRHVKRLTTELQNRREALNDQRREFRKLLADVRAERDAAVAAIERLREAVSGYPECDRYEEGDVISCGWKSAFASVVAALDGAPEPDWEVQYGRRNRETGALHWLTGDPRDDWWHENQDRYEHVKRYTSPPFPVEGEKP